MCRNQSCNLIKEKGLAYEERNGISTNDFSALSDECTGGEGFDDIVVLDPRSASRVSQIARLIARRGTMNMMGQTPLDGLVEMDLSRLHYDYIALLGNTSSDIGASYGEERNRCELRPGRADTDGWCRRTDGPDARSASH